MLLLMHYVKTLPDDQMVEFAFNGCIADNRRGRDFKNNEYQNLKLHWDELTQLLATKESAYATRQRKIKEKFFLHFNPLKLRDSYHDIDDQGHIPEASELGDNIVDEGATHRNLEKDAALHKGDTYSDLEVSPVATAAHVDAADSDVGNPDDLEVEVALQAPAADDVAAPRDMSDKSYKNLRTLAKQ